MSYWQDRMASSQTKLTNKSIKQIEKQMKKYYGTAMKKTIADFEATYNKVLAATAEGRKPTPADLYKLDAYWQIQAQMRQELQKLGDKQIAALSKAFELNFFEIYYSIGIPGMEAFNTASVEMAQQLINHIWCADGKSWSQRIWENNELLAATLNEELVNCVVAGKKTTELKNILQERFNVGYSRADALVRTELAHIQTQAAQQRYTDYGIKEMEVWADADERRCEVCGKLHQKRYPIGAVPPVPAHPRCRCCIVPVVE
jgi:SPP1 gp7 family putative phage head morphogenesis protein